MVIWCRRVWALTYKELLQLWRDRGLSLAIIYAFTVSLIIAGNGVSLQLYNAGFKVHDHDRSYASRELTSRFQEPYFNDEGHILRAQEGQELLDNGDEMMIVDIPSGFGRDLVAGRPTAIQVQIDTSNSVRGTLASSYVQQIVGRFGLEVSTARVNQPRLSPGIGLEQRAWFNPNQTDSWFTTISEMLNMITLLAIMLPATLMGREKERGTIEQLMVAPLTTLQIMLPKVLAMTIVVLCGTTLTIFLVIRGIFSIPIVGSLPLFLLLTAVYAFVTSGLGLVIATVTRNLAQVGMMSLLVFIPVLFLSGVWTPPEAVPDSIRVLMHLSPLYYYHELAFGILLKGAGVSLLWEKILGLLVMGSVMFGFGAAMFRRQFG